MKRVLLVVGLLLIGSLVKAEPLCTGWGAGLNVCLPLSSLEGAYGYNFNSKDGVSGNQALLETTILRIRGRVAITFGGAKSPSENPSPYMSVTYGVSNPITNEGNPLSWIRPGIYGGKKFDTKEYFYGLKAAVNVF